MLLNIGGTMKYGVFGLVFKALIFIVLILVIIRLYQQIRSSGA